MIKIYICKVMTKVNNFSFTENYRVHFSSKKGAETFILAKANQGQRCELEIVNAYGSFDKYIDSI